MRENCRSALSSLKANRRRSALTITIIAIGITALMGIQTALEVLAVQVNNSFGRMGASSYSITRAPSTDDVFFPELSISQASSFCSRFNEGIASMSSVVSTTASVSNGRVKSDPTVSIIASDEKYLTVRGGEIESGRNFNMADIIYASEVCLVGDKLKHKLFAHKECIGEYVTIGSIHYVVIGTIASEGALFGTGTDGSIIIPYTSAVRQSMGNEDFTISVIPPEGADFSKSIEQARALMKCIRRTKIGDQEDFVIRDSGSSQRKLTSIKSKLSIFALVIGLITMTGASVSLMNIMLVSVRERTREIGLRKALGATSGNISEEFLTESLMMGTAGGAAGIAAGIIAGNVVAIIMEGQFAVPWKWVAGSLIICTAVSLASGVMPARKAAALNPVEALHKE